MKQWSYAVANTIFTDIFLGKIHAFIQNLSPVQKKISRSINTVHRIQNTGNNREVSKRARIFAIELTPKHKSLESKKNRLTKTGFCRK